MNIIPYHKKYAPIFKSLNIEWLETYFYVEPYDLEVLSQPDKYIINKGGHIFFSTEGNTAYGTVALMPIKPGVFELTKMAVLPNTRGQGVGQKLMNHCIQFAKNNQMQKLILYSNTKLESAIYIYRKWGFKEIELESASSYERADIKMELIISP